MRDYRGEVDYNYSILCSVACYVAKILYKFSVQNVQIFYNIVEKLCESLCNCMSKYCGIFYDFEWKSDLCVVIMCKKMVFHQVLREFYHCFLARIYLCKIRLLHSIHIVYYYNYYFI